MNFGIFMSVVVMFILLTPGILVTLPPGGGKMSVTLVHALIFGLIFSMTHGSIMKLSSGQSYYEDDKMMKGGMSCS
jgi:hypothetical protein